MPTQGVHPGGESGAHPEGESAGIRGRSWGPSGRASVQRGIIGDTQQTVGLTCGKRTGAGVQGKEDKHDMAKTTRKTEANTGEKKPATRRPKAAPVAGAEQVATRRRTKASADAAPIAEAAGVRAASLKQPGGQGFGAEPTHDEIALRAWSIYENRGGGHGQAFDDWVEAKRQLHEERGLKA